MNHHRGAVCFDVWVMTLLICEGDVYFHFQKHVFMRRTQDRLRGLTFPIKMEPRQNYVCHPKTNIYLATCAVLWMHLEKYVSNQIQETLFIYVYLYTFFQGVNVWLDFPMEKQRFATTVAGTTARAAIRTTPFWSLHACCTTGTPTSTRYQNSLLTRKIVNCSEIFVCEGSYLIGTQQHACIQGSSSLLWSISLGIQASQGVLGICLWGTLVRCPAAQPMFVRALQASQHHPAPPSAASVSAGLPVQLPDDCCRGPQAKVGWWSRGCVCGQATWNHCTAQIICIIFIVFALNWGLYKRQLSFSCG